VAPLLRSLAATYKSKSTTQLCWLVVAAANGNCAVTNVTYNQNKYYVVTWIVYLESSMYLRRRQWLSLHHFVVVCRAGLKGRGPGAIFTAGPYDVFHDVIVCEIYLFADPQRSRLLFPVVDHVSAVLTRLLAAFKAHEMGLKINVSCPWL